MVKLIIERKQIVVIAVVAVVIFLLCFGFGYFFGRFEQVERNRKGLEVIPEVNNKFQMTNYK